MRLVCPLPFARCGRDPEDFHDSTIVHRSMCKQFVVAGCAGYEISANQGKE